jgi:DNA-directed RNA polymerase specialized sigma24 family protein
MRRPRFRPPVPSEGTNETLGTARTYRGIARVAGGAPTTVWRHMNRGREKTRTAERREQRLALVLARLGLGWSIRRIASDLGISRSAVERDLRLARHFASHGFDVVEMAQRTLDAMKQEREPSDAQLGDSR